jgi:hypothetical protein
MIVAINGGACTSQKGDTVGVNIDIISGVAALPTL